MNSIVRTFTGALVVLLAVLAGGTIYAAEAGSAPTSDQSLMIPSGVVAPAMRFPAAPAAVDAVGAARAAVDDALAVRSAAAAQPRYTCEPSADARVIDGIIVNKDCPAITAAKEAAQRAFAEQTRLDGECIGYGCSPEQDAEIDAGEAAAQEQYWARCTNTPGGVDGC